ncbi:unnamed protein product [Enterobius vermicularis]|uniref:UDENN FLCN/SMCR8-type domain-containing protein n=1 Tax=Enterobius vermicularis TaxID=51028 RepID=A0A0N4VJA2_ENTVE|nr:unnamed protein product [Enterobius vermicularis]
MSLLDDMVTWGKKNADPFNRLSCCIEPVLLVVEFCQVQGPRPLHCVPESPGSHLDLDSVAIWLMSSETVHGSTLILYNQQMALYACVHYSSFLDIHARAFQRPVSLALLTATKPTALVLKLFMDISRQLFSPLLSCNRQLFRNHLSQLIDLSDSIQKQNVTQYYALCPNLTLSPTRLSKIECLAAQARRLLPRFQAAYRNLSMSARLSRCSLHSASDATDCMSSLGTLHNTSLSPLSSIAPCAYSDFVRSLKPSRELFMKLKEHDERGNLFCTNRPILRLSSFGSYKSADDDGLLRLEILSDDFCDKERSLSLIIANLSHILSTIFAGERLAICASEQRMPTGQDLLRKLTLLCVELQPTKLFWNLDSNCVPRDCQIFGQTSAFDIPSRCLTEYEGAVIDLNTQRLKAKEYIVTGLKNLFFVGKAFSSLAKKRPTMFPSDRSLIAHIVSLLTDFCAIVYLSKHKGPQKVANVLSLGNGDIRMLVNLLSEIDLIKYGRLKDSLSNNSAEMKSLKL